MLTTAATDSFIGTAKNDSFVGTQATYNTGDLMIDATSTDSDTLTLTTTSNITATPTVSGIENITINAQKVGTFSFAGTSVSGATTVTVNRLDLLDGAIDGTGAVSLTSMRATNFVAGDQVSDFSVTMDTTSNIATAATVNATAATGDVTVANINYAGTTITGINDKDLSVTETAAATGSKATASVSGEVSVTNAVDELTLVATAATELTVDAIGDELTLSGDADITLNMTAATLNAEELVNSATGTVTVVVGTAAALDLTDVSTVNSVVLDADFNTFAIVVADSQLITTKTNQTNVDADNVVGETTGSFKFAVLDNENATTAVTLGGVTIGANDVFESVYLDATADKLSMTTLDIYDADLVVTGTQTIDLGTVTNANSIISTSTAAITVISDGNTADEQLIALGAGNDDVEVDDGGATDLFTVDTGAGDDTLTVTDAADESQFVTGAGADTVTLVTAGEVVLVTGTGDDEVTLGNTAAYNINLGDGANTLNAATFASTATIALGTGANTLTSTSADLTGATITGNVDTVNVVTSLDITSAQFNEFNGFALKGTGLLFIDGSAATTAQIIDASAITLAYGVSATVEIEGSNFGDTITGTIGADAITLGTGVDTVVIASGDSGMTGNGTDTTENTFDVITTFDDAEDFLSLGLAGDATATTGNYVEVAATDYADIAAIVTAADGAFATLSGTSSATTLYALLENDTTADADEAIATYLAIDSDADGTTDMLIELAGLTLADFSADNIIA
ncbi:MAG: hypothetical protein C0627_10995 [Sulfurimonas sp.]|nr:MAG: hypothetical protein C0627_10995 [Sulfurimonas sp.]